MGAAWLTSLSSRTASRFGSSCGPRYTRRSPSTKGVAHDVIKSFPHPRHCGRSDGCQRSFRATSSATKPSRACPHHGCDASRSEEVLVRWRRCGVPDRRDLCGKCQWENQHDCAFCRRLHADSCWLRRANWPSRDCRSFDDSRGRCRDGNGDRAQRRRAVPSFLCDRRSIAGGHHAERRGRVGWWRPRYH